MIRRAQAEALLKLAEALEECERNEVYIQGDERGDQQIISQVPVFDTGSTMLRPQYVRMAIAKLYPKSEEA